MSHFAAADIKAGNERTDELLTAGAQVWQPISDPDDRLLLMQHGRCPDCGHKYNYSTIPWQGGTCTQTYCRSYSPYQAGNCAKCKTPRWRCSC